MGTQVTGEDLVRRKHANAGRLRAAIDLLQLIYERTKSPTIEAAVVSVCAELDTVAKIVDRNDSTLRDCAKLLAPYGGVASDITGRLRILISGKDGAESGRDWFQNRLGEVETERDELKEAIVELSKLVAEARKAGS